MRIKILFFCFLTYFVFSLSDTAFAQEPTGSAFTMSDTLEAALLLTQAVDFNQKSDYQKAWEAAQRATDIFTKALGDSTLKVAETLHELGSALTGLGKYDQALQVYQKVVGIRITKLGSNNPELAKSFNNIANTYYYKGDYQSALLFQKKTLTIRIANFGEESIETNKSYGNLFWIYYGLGKRDSAEYNLQKSFSIMLKISDVNSPEMIIPYFNMAAFYVDTKNYLRSIDYGNEGLKLAIQHLGENHRRVSGFYNNLGTAYYNLGDMNKSLDFYYKALNIESNLNGEYSPELPAIYKNLSEIYLNKLEYEQAIGFIRKALQINLHHQSSQNPVNAGLYTQLGVLYTNIRDYKQALAYILQSISILENSLGKEHIELAYAYQALGSLYIKLQDYDKSIDFYKKSFHIKNKYYGENSLGLAQASNDLGNAYFYANNLKKAMECYQNSLETIHALGVNSYPDATIPLRNLANVLKQEGRYPEANNYLDSTLLLLQYVKPGDFATIGKYYNELLEGLADKGNLYKSWGNFLGSDSMIILSNKFFEEAIAAGEYQLFQLSQEESKKLLLTKSIPCFEGIMQTGKALDAKTNEQKYLKKLFTYLEKSHASLLYLALQESNALQFSGLPADLLQQEYDLRVDITYNEKRRQELISTGASETDTTVLAISGKLFDLKQGYETLKKRFETEYPDYYRLKYDLSTISSEEVQRDLLQPNQALLEYFAGDSSIFVFVLRPDTLVMQEVKKDFPLEDWVKSLRDNIYLNRTTGAVAYAEAAYNLYQKLVLPVKSLLPEQVIIIPDGILGYVPFEALLTAKPERAIRFNTHAYLLKEHQINYCYSATLLREMQQKKSVKEPASTLLAVAPFYSGDTSLLANLFAYDETTRKDLAPLQHSGEEVYRISKLWKGEVLTGADATEEKFTSQASNYKILHLATHGRADERVGDYSFLAFSEIKDSMENELLYVRDLYNLQLNADLVVLSACETGLGKLSRGEGIISLARAFAYAGAKSIVTTLWSVDDAKTKDLMVEFYRKLKKGLSKDAALRQAKLDYLTSHTNPADAHPFYWAGFAPIGDMRALR